MAVFLLSMVYHVQCTQFKEAEDSVGKQKDYCRRLQCRLLPEKKEEGTATQVLPYKVPITLFFLRCYCRYCRFVYCSFFMFSTLCKIMCKNLWRLPIKAP